MWFWVVAYSESVSRSIAEEQTPGRRRRSEAKKSAILEAAESLFLAEGYERASVDAIADLAQVSKRTVYDHFGDKANVFLRTLERASTSLTNSVRLAIDEELLPGRDLRSALIAFATRITSQTVPSSEYLTFRTLSAHRPPQIQLPPNARYGPERMLEVRFAELAEHSEIAGSAPALAARHFTALTVGLVLDALRDGESEWPHSSDTGVIIADGVDAFLRAYS